MNNQFAHFNFNVIDLERSLAFYREALGFVEKRRKTAEDGSFIIVFLTDGETDFELELTWLRDWEKPSYDLGDCEFHLAVRTEDLAAAREKHEQMGCVCYVNEKMGIYFIQDPDGYWIEMIPQRR